VAGAAAAVVYAPATAVDTLGVEVAGSDEVAAAELAAEVELVAGVAPGDPWLLVDPAAVRRRVEALPTVGSVGVRRTWPDAVTIQVAPRRTVALLDLDGAVAEIAPGGRVARLLEAGEPPSALVGTITVDPSLLPGGLPAVGSALADPVRRAVLVVEQLPVDLRAVLADGRLAGDASLEFVLRDGGRVRMGELDDLPAKVHSARSVLTGSVDVACLAVLDVRRPDRPTITRRSDCDIDPPTVDTTVVARPSTTVPATAPATAPAGPSGG
ncbi:MAG: cell division protein FtsQ/DivIB, partial [Microthrixaceae bacterium]